MSDWERVKGYINLFTCTETFNGCKYVVEVQSEDRTKSIRLWVAVSSGKKRKELKIFEEKENKSLGGLKALLWIKKVVLDFPRFYKELYRTEDIKLYICISWADSRRRDIYQRLEKEGFFFRQIDGSKTLVKEV